jgi:PAS domain S-box-containing protein
MTSLLFSKNRLIGLPVLLAVVFAIWILKVFHDITTLQNVVNEQMSVVQQLGEVEKDIRDLRAAFILSSPDEAAPRSDWGLLYAVYWKRTGSLDLSSVRRDFIDPHLARVDALISHAALVYASQPTAAVDRDPVEKGETETEYLHSLSEALSQIKGAVGIVRAQIAEQYVTLEGKWYQLKILIWVSCLLALFSAVLINGYQRVSAERKRIRKDLRAVEARFLLLFENAAFGIAVIDADGRLEQANPALVRMLGYTAEELSEMTFADLTFPEDFVAERAHIFRMKRDKRDGYLFHKRLVRKNGEVFWAQFSLTVVEDGGRATYSFAMIEDITSRKRHEAEIIAARDRAEEMTRVKSAFLANMHHEFRTPLSVILVGASVLKDDALPEQLELISDIQENGRRLLEMLDSILQFAQIEEGKIELHPETIDAGEVIRNVVASLDTLAAAQGLTLTFEGPEQPVETHVDRQALQRIIHELVGNAIKFTPDGSVSVTLEAGKRRLRLHVRDTGAGISPAFLPHVFEAFRQESFGDARTHEGAGLGLAVTRQLVDMMNGTITVKSEKGAGTLFTVTLPRSAPAAGRPPVRRRRNGRRDVGTVNGETVKR